MTTVEKYQPLKLTFSLLAVKLLTRLIIASGLIITAKNREAHI